MTAASGTVPPFELAALTFFIGGLIGIPFLVRNPLGLALFKQPPVVWALGTGGLFLYHAVYFAALRLAPPAEAGLIAYLWPLLIVLMSSFLPGEKLKPGHLIGGMAGFAGVAILLAGRKGGLDFDRSYLSGYGLAFLCAFIWSAYSVLSRRYKDAPTEMVAVYCLLTAGFSFLAHLAFEETIWPQTAIQWYAVLALGLGPVGAAFYLWDRGVKLGDIRLLGVLSYAAPVMSTLLLVLLGFAESSLSLGLATALIVGGAYVANRANQA
jgi:drug/metabolite transporter (DMT)-like permease